MPNSRRKGTDGERELSAKLREYGFEGRRGQQYSGANGDADVIGLPGVHIECKRVERLDLYAAVEQSKDDARDQEIPAVFHRKNRKEWLVTLPLGRFIDLYKSYLLEKSRNESL